MGRGHKNMTKLTEEQQQLVEENIGLAYDRASKLFDKYSSYNFGMEKDDYISSAMVGLCYAARSYNPNSGYKFSTYAVRSINQKIKDCIFNINNNIISLDEQIGGNYEYSETNEIYDVLGAKDEAMSISELMIDLQKILSEVEYGMIIDSVVNGMTYEEIAKKYGYSSKQSVCNKVNKCYERLKRRLGNTYN